MFTIQRMAYTQLDAQKQLGWNLNSRIKCSIRKNDLKISSAKCRPLCSILTVYFIKVCKGTRKLVSLVGYSHVRCLCSLLRSKRFVARKRGEWFLSLNYWPLLIDIPLCPSLWVHNHASGSADHIDPQNRLHWSGAPYIYTTQRQETICSHEFIMFKLCEFSP